MTTALYAKKFSNAQRALDDWSAQLQQSTNDRITRSVFDAAGREIYRINASGKTVERSFDAAGNVLTEIIHAQSLHLTQYSKAHIDSALIKNNPSDHLTQYQYDAAGRLLQQTDASKHSTRYTYDKANNVTSKLEANNACWRYVYNETNQLIETHSPVSTFSKYQGTTLINETREIITLNDYDSFGNVITVIRDAGGINQILQYTYDGNNRKIETIYPNRSVQKANQAPSTARQEELQTLRETSCYNAFGELIAQRDRAGNWQHTLYFYLPFLMAS